MQKASPKIRGHHYPSLLRQKGLALLVVAFAIGIAATAYAIYSFNASDVKIAQHKATADALSAAKAGLIAWATSNPDQPGMLPYPDRNGDDNYDGNSDCSTAAFNYSFLIGRLPWRAADNADCANLESGMGSDLRDGTGQPLWYAVSRNLVYNYPGAAYPVINPGIINSPTYSWLVVRDKHGNLLSNRVAAVIIAPGAAIDDQDRSAAAPDADNFLDTFTLSAGGGARSNRTYAFPDEDFYMGEDMDNVADSDNSYVRPYNFNDKLIYVTIDELMAEVEKRAAAEAKSALNDYFQNTGYYPQAAPLLINQTYHCKSNQLQGMLPISTSANISSCSCSSSTSCSCPFNQISSVSFRRSGTATWSATNVFGSCSRTPDTRTCTCTGSGFCRNTTGSRNFTCDAAGNCSANTTGTFTFNGVFNGVTANTQSGNCSLSLCGNTPSPVNAAPPAATCTGSGSFSYVSCGDAAFNSAATKSALPAWFTNNFWQNYLYYAVSTDCINGQDCQQPNLSAGNKTSIHALLVAAGNPVIATPFAAKGSAQNQPSCTANDYLDSAENSDADTVFDSTSSPRGSSYNDIPVVVAP